MRIRLLVVSLGFAVALAIAGLAFWYFTDDEPPEGRVEIHSEGAAAVLGTPAEALSTVEAIAGFAPSTPRKQPIKDMVLLSAWAYSGRDTETGPRISLVYWVYHAKPGGKNDMGMAITQGPGVFEHAPADAAAVDLGIVGVDAVWIRKAPNAIDFWARKGNIGFVFQFLGNLTPDQTLLATVKSLLESQ